MFALTRALHKPFISTHLYLWKFFSLNLICQQKLFVKSDKWPSQWPDLVDRCHSRNVSEQYVQQSSSQTRWQGWHAAQSRRGWGRQFSCGCQEHWSQAQDGQPFQPGERHKVPLFCRSVLLAWFFFLAFKVSSERQLSFVAVEQRFLFRVWSERGRWCWDWVSSGEGR